MPNAEEVFARFERDKHGYDWSGEPVYRFWGGCSLYTIIDIDYGITYPTRRQLLVLDSMLNYPRDIRPEVESALFDHYQSDIYGSVMEPGSDQFEERTPTLNSSNQIWDVLGEPSIRINYIADDDPDDGVRFRLAYIDCPWDHEHGFGIQMQDWKIDEFGGEVD